MTDSNAPDGKLKIKVPDPDAEQPLLPLLLEELDKRSLRYEDFPDGPLPWPEQRQLIDRALERGRVLCAAGLAGAYGFSWSTRGGFRTPERHLRAWLKKGTPLPFEVAKARVAAIDR